MANDDGADTARKEKGVQNQLELARSDMGRPRSVRRFDAGTRYRLGIRIKELSEKGLGVYEIHARMLADGTKMSNGDPIDVKWVKAAMVDLRDAGVLPGPKAVKEPETGTRDALPAGVRAALVETLTNPEFSEKKKLRVALAILEE